MIKSIHTLLLLNVLAKCIINNEEWNKKNVLGKRWNIISFIVILKRNNFYISPDEDWFRKC